MNELVTLWAFIVASFVIGAFAGVAYISTRHRVQPKTLTPVLTPAKSIPDDVVISNNWEAVYRNSKSRKAQWIIHTNFNKIIVTISRNWTKRDSNALWDVYTEIYGSGKRPFVMGVYVNNHIEYMELLRKKYPMNCVHSTAYIDHVMNTVYKAMKNPAEEYEQ